MNFLLLKPNPDGAPTVETAVCDTDNPADFISKAVDGDYQSCSLLFDEIGIFSAAYCNSDFLYRKDLNPLMYYETDDDLCPSEKATALLKGNVVIVGIDPDGNIAGLTDFQIRKQKAILESISLIEVQDDNGQKHTVFYQQH